MLVLHKISAGLPKSHADNVSVITYWTKEKVKCVLRYRVKTSSRMRLLYTILTTKSKWQFSTLLPQPWNSHCSFCKMQGFRYKKAIVVYSLLPSFLTPFQISRISLSSQFQFRISSETPKFLAFGRNAYTWQLTIARSLCTQDSNWQLDYF
jgi:hypothetical protein